MNLQESIRRIISEYTEGLDFIFDPKTNKVIGFNLVYGSKEFNNIRYDKSGRSRDYGFGPQKDSFDNPIKFDSLEDAQKWYSDKTEKQLQKQTQNQKYSDLSYIAYNIRKIDDLDYQVINRGSCFKFAKEISKLGYDKFTFIFSEEDQEVIHVYVKLTNNLYFDANGFHTKKEIKNQYYVGEDTEMYDSDIDELGNFSDLDTYECLTTISIPDNVWKKVTQVINKSKSNQQELDEYARTLKNARQQGVGLRFPKSAIKSNPSRFRPYNRKGVNESDLETNQNDKKIVCEKCGWSWDLSDGGDDPYTCHKCGNENHKEMSLQESIRRIIREETKLNPMILRRVRRDDLEREFEESLDGATNSVFHLIRNGGGIMVLDRFKYITVSRLIDGIHYEIYSTTPEDSVWYDEVFNSLKDYYTDRIEVRYKKLMSEI